MAGQPQLECPINPAFQLGIDMTKMQVTDPSGNPSNFIIDAGSGFSVSATFLIGGTQAAGFAGAKVKYTVEYYYEGFGGAAEGTLGQATNTSDQYVASTTCAGALEYSGDKTKLDVAAGNLPAGLYKLSGVVTFDPAWAMFGFIEGPVIRQL
jgi:hypothetical protein